jgi:hypothetical protein
MRAPAVTPEAIPLERIAIPITLAMRITAQLIEAAGGSHLWSQ